MQLRAQADVIIDLQPRDKHVIDHERHVCQHKEHGQHGLSHARELQVPVFRNGELVYQLPTLDEIRSYCREQVDTLWDEVKRFDNPHTYYVDLSQKLWEIKYRLLKDNACGEHHA